MYSIFGLLANMPNRLQCLDVPIVSDEDCDRAYPGMITRRMMCAGYMDGGRDACNVRTAAIERRHRCVPAHTPSICLTGRLRQPPGVFRRSPWTGVVGSGVCPSQLPRSLCQSVWIPLLDRWRPTNLLLKKITQSSQSSTPNPHFGFSLATFSSFLLLKIQHVWPQCRKIKSSHSGYLHFLWPLSLSFVLIMGINRWRWIKIYFQTQYVSIVFWN